MATIIIELVDSRAVTVDETNPSAELLYMVHGTEDEGAANLKVQESIPPVWVIPRNGLDPLMTFFTSYNCRHRGGGVWDVMAHYGKGAKSDVVINFDTGGGTTHVTQSIKTLRSYYIDPTTNVQGAAPDLRGAINYDGQRIAGVDIGLAVYKWSETWKFRRTSITAAYRRVLKSLTKTVNKERFREFDIGEVLFEGVSGLKDQKENFADLTFHFAQSDNSNANQKPIIIQPFTDIEKRGWEYLWIQYGRVVDGGVNLMRPRAIRVEQVYHDGDFEGLSIGTLPLD